MRGVAFRGGYHDFNIERGGLSVFPRLVAAEQERSWQAQQRDPQIARYDDGPYYPYVATGLYPNRPFRFKNTEPPFFEIGTHKNQIGNPSRKPMHHHSRSSGRSKHQ